LITKFDIVNKYLGIPYVHQGRELNGLDCYGLIARIYEDLGYELFDIEGYDKNWSFEKRNHLLVNYHRQWIRCKEPRMLFDAVLFKGTKNPVNHGGVMIDDTHFIHCCKQGTIVSRITEPKWEIRIESFYHLKERDIHDTN